MRLLILMRSLIATLLMPLIVLFLGTLIVICYYVFRKRSIENYIIRLWGIWVCWLSGVEVRLHNAEVLPAGGYLLLFNHASFFDIFALVQAVDGLRFGAKAELFKIPVFAQAMTIAGTLPIARDNRQEVIRVYDDAKKRFAKGAKFALSPEGGRFYNPEKLSPFKSGPFIFAISSSVPIVPAVIHGAYEVLPKGGFLFNTRQWKSVINIHFLSPIETSSYSIEQRHQLMSEVYEKMNTLWLQKPTE